MLERFQGPEGSRVLMAALSHQRTLQCHEDVIKALASAAHLQEYSPGSPLIIQNSDDNRIGFILSGLVEIQVNGSGVAKRKAGEHVGEMAVLDPSATRSASVVALADTCVAWVNEGEFTPIAEANPFLWRRIAIEIAARLRERGALVRPRNEKPIIFIGSSSAALRVVRSIQKRLQSDTIEVKPWTEGVFELSETTIESLERIFKLADFAVLVLAADDKLKGSGPSIPRDNVILELGLSMGAIERRRTFVLVEDKKPKLRLPSDLASVTYIKFSRSDSKALRRDMTSAAQQIMERITKLGPR